MLSVCYTNGTENYKKIGLVVQKAILLQTAAACIFGVVWFESEQLFLLCQLKPQLSKLAGDYTRWFTSFHKKEMNYTHDLLSFKTIADCCW